MPSFSVSQGTSIVEISSDAAGFSQDSPYRYYLNNADISLRSDDYLISFGDGSSIRLTDFNEIPFASGGSSPSQSVIGIPAAAEGSFANSFNIIGGYGYLSTFDIYDNVSGLRLLNDYQPQFADFTPSPYFFEPFAQFGYSSGALTIQAPRKSDLMTPGSAQVDSAGIGVFSPAASSYVGGFSGTAENQLISGGGPTPWVFALTIPGPPAPVCFAKGTLIMMADSNELPIETLSVGDLAATSNGALPIKWIGRRTVHRLNTPAQKYEESIPVRITAGSLGENRPHLDLLVSDSHGICVDGKIVNACHLINRLNICKDDPKLHPNEISYFHLEFDEEVLVLANGVQACSYVNNGNRRSFDNYPEFISIHVNPELTVKSLVSRSPRTQPSLDGQKYRIRRSWHAA